MAAAGRLRRIAGKAGRIWRLWRAIQLSSAGDADTARAEHARMSGKPNLSRAYRRRVTERYARAEELAK